MNNNKITKQCDQLIDAIKNNLRRGFRPIFSVANMPNV